jgi:hypothetical protein
MGCTSMQIQDTALGCALVGKVKLAGNRSELRETPANAENAEI